MTVIVTTMQNNRDYKNFTVGSYYHVYNRGNEKSLIFKDNEDYEVFIFFLREALYPEHTKSSKRSLRRSILPTGSFTLSAWCLMPNHYHFLLKQNSETSISKLITKICTSYAKYFNKKYVRVGHLFQDKCKSVLIKTDEQFLYIIEYIHQNPVRAGLVEKSLLYPWSSTYRAL